MPCEHTAITYDTGFVRDGTISRQNFDLDLVKRELGIIRDDLRCTAVRITGGNAERLEQAAKIAADLGLEVWFSPYPLELTADEMLALFTDCAERAEQLREQGAEVVFVAGAELTLMNKGFLPGDTQEDRLEALLTERDRLAERVSEISARVNEFLGKAVPLVRERFGGRVTYAAIPLERVDWSLLDIVSVDLYRSAEVADQFADGVRNIVAQGKPVAITEFGSGAYRGAGDAGARFMEIVEYDNGQPARLNGEYVRDEAGQARYIRELLETFNDGGVDSTFVFLFALDGFFDELDMASPSIVKMLDGEHGTTYPDMPWEPKAAFAAIADYNRKAVNAATSSTGASSGTQ
ncbi:hypothetical protein LWC34_46710 [Kibdelosporangium philippinense]|uniref:Abortive infection protein n=1 Tax=Kibdelosporangium philippinense TaxID=211113 RepID=A0ABS8ZUZ9_9PSEU|nr:hypothetical protein [Kibdelosporangium philippinense]MCE7010248.1 hypothetical protein [Kibdelosporangium philippinense]